MIPFILTMAAKASIILSLAFVVTLLMRRASAASRHVVWLAAFTGVLVLPVAFAVLPRLNIPVLRGDSWSTGQGWSVAVNTPSADIAIAEAQRQAELNAAVAIQNANAAQLNRELAQLDAKLAQIRVTPGPDTWYVIDAPPEGRAFWGGAAAPWASRVFMLWLFGFVMVAVAFAVGVLRTYVLACSAAPAGELLTEEAEVLAAELGIARDVRIVTWDGPAMPMTWGALRPVVLLPQDARNWPAQRRREVLTHELAHVSRGDYLARLLAALVCAIHWFNPLAWMASRRLRDEQELACDDVVLAGGAEPSDYAAHLLAVARSFRVPSLSVGNATVAMARPSQLSDRLLAMLDSSRRHAPAAPHSGRLAWLLTFALTLPLAAAIPVARGIPAPFEAEYAQAVAEAADADATPVAIAEIPDVAPLVALPATNREGEICPRNRGSGSSHTGHQSNSTDDGAHTVTLSLREGDCQLEIRMYGTVRFNEAETDIATLSRNAWIRVTEDNRGVERRFDMQWRDDRQVRRFRVDGNDVAESDELRAWLATAIQTAFRRTGFNVVARTMRAYRAGGLDSALALAADTESDYSKRMVLMALIDSVQVPPGEAARIARMTRDMSSDYEKAELLIAIANRLRLDGAVQDAMVAAAAGMSSDYERRRVLTVALGKSDLSREATEGLLRVAENMSSDYEKVELLLTYLRAEPFDADRREHLFGAANSISSDYERRRLLSMIVQRMEQPAIIGEVTASAARMSSDYEKAELLVQIMRKFGSNSQARAGVLRAAESMSSDYEKNRVLALLARQ